MKKSILSILVLFVIFGLTGCQLATDNTILPKEEEQTYLVPYKLEASIPSLIDVDLSEYLFIGFDCNGEVKQDHTCSNFGKSTYGTFGLHVHDNFINDELESSTSTYNFDVVIYFGSALAGEMILFEMVFKNMETEEDFRYHASHATDIYSGMGLGFKREGM